MITEDQAFSDMVQAEDIGICELVQRGVQSRSYDKGRFSVLQEEAVWHFQTLVKKALGSVTQ
jgi:choline monooxygenase